MDVIAAATVIFTITGEGEPSCNSGRLAVAGKER
jgi:hypothetical protein